MLILLELSQCDASFRMGQQPSNDGETASLRAGAETPRCPRKQLRRRMDKFAERFKMPPGAAQLVGDWGKNGPGSVNHTGVPEKNLKATPAGPGHTRAFHRPCTLCKTKTHCQESAHLSTATAAFTPGQPGTPPADPPSTGPFAAPLT